MIKTANLIIQDKNKRILLVKRAKGNDEPNVWSIPGGTVEIGETLKETLFREIKEELNFDIESYNFFRSYNLIVNNVEVEANYFFGEVSGDLVFDKNEISEVFWFEIAELPDNLPYKQSQVLKDYLESL